MILLKLFAAFVIGTVAAAINDTFFVYDFAAQMVAATSGALAVALVTS